MALHAIRAIFLLAVLAIATTYATTPEILSNTGSVSPVAKVTLVILLPVVVAVLIMLLDIGVEHKSLSNISGLFFGVVAGVVLAYVLGLVIDLVAAVFLPVQFAQEGPAGQTVSLSAAPAPRRASPAGSQSATTQGAAAEDRGDHVASASGPQFVTASEAKKSALLAMIKLLVGASTVYLCVSFVMQTKDDFRFIIPYVEFTRHSRGTRPLLLDTSVVIDGRIADIADTRILTSPLIVPKFVLEELQGVADSSDKLKRNRGRRGLDILNRLQANPKVQIRISDARVPAVEQATEVDQKLVALAQHLDGGIVTNDYNLNKVAQLRGVEVININDLANALKPVFLPGEMLGVKIIKPGEEAGQGIGYLDDGTMVVAEQAREYVGQEVSIIVTSVLQTSAGRMIFGKPDGAAPTRSSGPTRPMNRRPQA